LLAAHQGTADATGIDVKFAVFRVMADRGLTIERMVKLTQVSRDGYYRFEESARSGSKPDMELRDAIQRIALEWPSYGQRRITQELRSAITPPIWSNRSACDATHADALAGTSDFQSREFA
jgi:hypothetical protein